MKIKSSLSETPAHIRLKHQAINLLYNMGFSKKDITTEFKIENKLVDVVGTNNERKIAIECGDINEGRLEFLSQHFDRVIHIPYLLRKYSEKPKTFICKNCRKLTYNENEICSKCERYKKRRCNLCGGVHQFKNFCLKEKNETDISIPPYKKETPLGYLTDSCIYCGNPMEQPPNKSRLYCTKTCGWAFNNYIKKCGKNKKGALKLNRYVEPTMPNSISQYK